MTSRLANRARAIKRKRARSGDNAAYAVLTRGSSSPDPWANIPAHQRITVTKTLASGAIVTSYVDTLADHFKPATRAPEKTSAPVPLEQSAPVVREEQQHNPDNPWSLIDKSDERTIGDSQ